MVDPTQDPEKLLAAVRSLERALTRKIREADSLRLGLEGVLRFLRAGYDPEDEHFSGSDAAEDELQLPLEGGHWCAQLIQLLEDEFLSPNIKYAPFEDEDKTCDD